MRVRNVLATFGAAVLLTSVLAAPASAGTGSSTWCDDDAGHQEIPVLTSPLTVGVEVAQAPGTDRQTLVVCYSTTPPGQPGNVTGGAIVAEVATGTDIVYPSGSVAVSCHPDYVSGAGPACDLANRAEVAFTDGVWFYHPGQFCLVAVGPGCAAYIPGVMGVVGGDPARPLLSVTVVGTSVAVAPPERCVAVFTPCP